MTVRVPRHCPRRLSLTVALALATLAGCGLHNPHPIGSFERGAYYSERGNNLEAVAALETFVRQNPTDSLAAEAQFLKAETYLQMKEYPLAAVEYQILRKDYPTSPLVVDADYREGVAYLQQVGSVARDVTGAHEARLHFVSFLERYPDSAHSEEVLGHLQAISDIMVEKRLGQARVYGQLGRYEAVALVLDDMIRYEAGSSLLDQVIWQRAQVAERLDDQATAATMYRRLVDEYPDTKLADRARNALGSLDDAAVADS
ncbi:MAG: outer membrane protein assembly factor BamD [bacterium]|nr:outer membrane protein assembly factor BamD [bacterium]